MLNHMRFNHLRGEHTDDDEDPTLFDFIYLSKHTCIQSGAAAGKQAATAFGLECTTRMSTA